MKLLLLGACALVRVGGCEQHPLTDYRPLDQAGMWSSKVEQLKSLNASDAEVAQLVKLKQSGLGDQTCIQLVSDARQFVHPFSSAEAAINLVHAGYSETLILEIANKDQLDIVSGDAVMLRLVGLSDSAVNSILRRRLAGLRTMGSAQIGRLKNTGLSEKQIMERISAGMTDAQADREATVREVNRNHSGTGFVRRNGKPAR